MTRRLWARPAVERSNWGPGPATTSPIIRTRSRSWSSPSPTPTWPTPSPAARRGPPRRDLGRGRRGAGGSAPVRGRESSTPSSRPWSCAQSENPDTAAKEIVRVLRPGGRLLVLEHVRSGRPGLATWQDRLEHPGVGGGAAIRTGTPCGPSTPRDSTPTRSTTPACPRPSRSCAPWSGGRPPPRLGLIAARWRGRREEARAASAAAVDAPGNRRRDRGSDHRGVHVRRAGRRPGGGGPGRSGI